MVCVKKIFLDKSIILKQIQILDIIVFLRHFFASLYH